MDRIWLAEGKCAEENGGAEASAEKDVQGVGEELIVELLRKVER